jgi:NAD(P)-dependent dehydrogenase (short-subunit alcohol dehydrogenase family)
MMKDRRTADRVVRRWCGQESDMTTALIVGASRGIGAEFVRALAARGVKVAATVRDDLGRANVGRSATSVHELDVVDAGAVARLKDSLAVDRIDLLIHVAGIFGPREGASAMPDPAEFDRVMRTNVLGLMQTIVTLAPYVAAAKGRFVAVTSDLGSIANARSSHGWIYRASKAALNMAVRSAAADYPDATFVAMSPGWVRTDMGGTNAPLSVEESVRGMLEVIDRLKVEDSGTYRDYAGRSVLW